MAGTAAAAAVTTGVGIMTFQQESAQAQADRAERIKGAEVRIEKVEMELDRKENELEKIADRLDVVSDRAGSESLRQELKAMSARLKAIESASAVAGAPTAEQVARILIRDYADVLRGPEGPRGATGAKGEKGEQGDAGGGSANPNAPIAISTEYQSAFEDQYWGDARVSLIGCSGKGTRVKCSLVAFPEQEKFLNLFADRSRVALPNGVFAQGTAVTIGNQRSSRVQETLSAGVPTKIEYEFALESGGHDGLLEIKLLEYTTGEYLVWKNIPLSQ